MPIEYVTGDATEPIGDGTKLIVHVNNDIGGWGSGFVLALSAKWSRPEEYYRMWAKDRIDFEAGMISPVKVEEDIWVINMIAQNGTISRDNPKPINYEALTQCLTKVSWWAARFENPSVHMPRIGCGLAGGDWNTVEAIIRGTLVWDHVPVTVYDLPGQPWKD